MLQRRIWACVVVWLVGLICSINATMDILQLATSLNYPMPNTDNCCTWPGVKCYNATEPEEIQAEIILEYFRDSTNKVFLASRWDNFNLTGSLPYYVIDAPLHFNNLKILSLANNVNITGGVTMFASGFPVLQSLVLYGCTKIDGALLSHVFVLPSIIRLDLSYTSVDGIIDYPTFTPSPTLMFLLIEGAKLTANFPQWLDKAPNITNIKLGANFLTGELPANLASLANLVELNINNNLLTGTIPAEYASLTKLNVMRIGLNQFNGSIPDQFFANMPDLNTFEASGLAFTGTIPNSLSNRPKLQMLDLTGGAFTGTVPDWLEHKVDLQALRLDGTSFTGTLPPLDLLTVLRVLSLSNTKISGPIPQIGNLNLFEVKLFNSLVSGCWSQDDLTVEKCTANQTQLCCAPQACLPLGTTCVPDDSTFSEPVVVTTMVFTENTTITMTPGATITVTTVDCIQFKGKLIVEIDYAKLNLTLDQLVLIYYSCRNSSFDSIEFKQINQPTCLTDQPQIQYNPSQLSLVLPSTNQCSPNSSIPDWAIAVIVVGGLIIVTGVLLLALYYSPMREKVFPYARK